MKLSVILAPMLDGKADHELIRRTIIAYEAEQNDALSRRRENDAKRQAEKRQREKSRDITLHHSDRSLVTRAEDSSSRLDTHNKKENASPLAQQKRATRLAGDWVIPDEWVAEAVSAGLPRQRALSEAERMKNWSLSAKNGAKLDWHAAWRNWYRDKIEPSQPTKPPDRPPRNAGEAARLELLRRENLDAPHTEIRHHDESDGGPGFAGTGIARRIALASSRQC
jgi:hypothetical protein